MHGREACMNDAFFERQPLFVTGGDSHYRIPSITVTKGGSVVAICNDRRESVHDRVREQWLVARRSADGIHWDPLQVLSARADWSSNIQNIHYDALHDKVIALYRQFQYNADTSMDMRTVTVLSAESTDGGVTWKTREVSVAPNRNGLTGSAHGSGAGIQLRHGPHKGRLISCARVCADHSAASERLEMLQTIHYNCSLYSDDYGKTWQTGGQVQAGTGEGVLCELSDGSIYLNSRAYFNDGMRRVAWSLDGGETFGEFSGEPQLPEIDFGVNASLVCQQGLGKDGQDLCVYTSLDDRKTRRNMTAWVSFDGARTWPRKKLIDPRPTAYSSLAYDESRDCFHMIYELGNDDPYDLGICAARFNLSWLLSD